VPQATDYKVLFSTDDKRFGGAGLCENKIYAAKKEQLHGLPCSLELTLPGLSVMFLGKIAAKEDY